MNVSLQIEENRWDYSLTQNTAGIALTEKENPGQHNVSCIELTDHSVTPEIEDNVWEYSLESTGDTIETYGGPYSVTPSGGQQILETKRMRMADNVTIEPIPSNYGLITWNGSVLTVS